MPPPSALAGRPSVRMAMVQAQERRKKRNLVGWMWSVMGGKKDKEKEKDKSVVKEANGEEQKEEDVAPTRAAK